MEALLQTAMSIYNACFHVQNSIHTYRFKFFRRILFQSFYFLNPTFSSLQKFKFKLGPPGMDSTGTIAGKYKTFPSHSGKLEFQFRFSARTCCDSIFSSILFKIMNSNNMWKIHWSTIDLVSDGKEKRRHNPYIRPAVRPGPLLPPHPQAVASYFKVQAESAERGLWKLK